MGLYQLKNFLTFDDVADYLREEEIHNFNLLNQYDYIRLKDFIFSLVSENKIFPIFEYVGNASILEYKKNLRNNTYEVIDIYENIPLSYHLLLTDELFLKIKNDNSFNFNIKGESFFHWTDRELEFNGHYQKYKIQEDFYINLNNIVYSRIDFDYLFDMKNGIIPSDDNKTAILHLQNENTQLKARIAELESQVKNLDARTENNLIRALLVVNEWAKSKNGKYLDFDKEYNKSHLQDLNTQLELLGHKNMGETAYKTLIELVKKAKSKGL